MRKPLLVGIVAGQRRCLLASNREACLFFDQARLRAGPEDLNQLDQHMP